MESYNKGRREYVLFTLNIVFSLDIVTSVIMYNGYNFKKPHVEFLLSFNLPLSPVFKRECICLFLTFLVLLTCINF